MKITDITPEKSLATLFKGQILVGTAHKVVPVFRAGEVPTDNEAEDFIIVEQNGTPRVYTHGMEVLSGYVMASYYTKLKADGTIRYARIDKILDQMQTVCADATDSKYFYELDRKNLVTTPTANYRMGYSYMRVNIHWHTK